MIKENIHPNLIFSIFLTIYYDLSINIPFEIDFCKLNLKTKYISNFALWNGDYVYTLIVSTSD